MAFSDTKVAAMKRAAESTSQSAPGREKREESDFTVKHLRPLEHGKTVGKMCIRPVFNKHWYMEIM